MHTFGIALGSFIFGTGFGILIAQYLIRKNHRWLTATKETKNDVG